MTYTPPTDKTWEVIKAGKRGFYWLAYRPWVELDIRYDYAHDTEVDSDADTTPWLIAEGFAATAEEARVLAKAALESAPGEYRAYYYDGTRRWYDATRHGREIYRRRYTHKRIPTPVTSTESRLEGALGYLWRNCGDSWEKHPITKITAKRIWIASNSHYHNPVQHSFDRAKLESKGRIHGYYTEAGKNVEEHEQRERRERSRDEWRAKHGDVPYPGDVHGHLPLLVLTPPFDRKDVLRAFRRRSLQLHPDHGGQASEFRQLVVEKNQALNLCKDW